MNGKHCARHQQSQTAFDRGRTLREPCGSPELWSTYEESNDGTLGKKGFEHLIRRALIDRSQCILGSFIPVAKKKIY